MRRTFFLLLVVSILPLGCGENPGAKASREARTDLERVLALVGEVERGYLHSEKGLKEMGDHKPAFIKFDDAALKAAMSSGDVRSYQAALIGQAEKEITPMLTRGQTSQKVIAHQLLASLHLSAAGFEQRTAMTTSDSLAQASAAIDVYIYSIENAVGVIGRYTDDDKPAIEKWSQDQQAVTASVAKLKGEVDTLAAEIAGLEGQINTLAAQRDDAFKRARDLSAQAFPKKGQEQHDLYIKAIEAEREAQIGNSKIDDLTVTLNLAKAKHTIANRELTIGQQWSKLLTDGVGDAQKRKDDIVALEATIAQQRQEVAKRLTDDFKALVERQEKEVEGRLATALKKVNEAIELLAKANAMAIDDLKTATKFDQLNAAVIKLNVQADTIVATNRMAIIAKQLKDRVGAFITDPLIDAQLTKATESRKTSIDESRKTVNEINMLARDPAVTAATNSDDALSQARAARVRSAQQLAAGHAALITAHGGPAVGPAPEPAPVPAPESTN